MLRRFLRRTSEPARPAQQVPDPKYARLWWVLDPTHAHHCEDCKRLAANSPYDAPWTDGNLLHQSPGDGRTHCGADCTCALSYVGAGDYAPPAGHQSVHRRLLAVYTHGQAWYLESEGQADAILAEPDTRKWPREVPELDYWPDY